MALIVPLTRPLCDFTMQSFSLLIQTPHPEKTCAFYAAIFEKIGKDTSSACYVKFSPGESRKCDIEWKGQFSEKDAQFFHLREDPDGRTVYISSEEASGFEHLALPLTATVVLRCQKIMSTLAFYERASSWQTEKHGSGPTHYSSRWSDALVEIYPQRKSFSAPVELVLPVDNLAETLEYFKHRQFKFLHESPTSALLQDPDHGIVNLIAHSLTT